MSVVAVVGFTDEALVRPKSNGTTDTLERAKAAGLPTRVFHEGRWS